MTPSMTLAELQARQLVVRKASDAATDMLFTRRRGTPAYREWEKIATACQRELRLLHRRWKRWYGPEGWTA